MNIFGGWILIFSKCKTLVSHSHIDEGSGLMGYDTVVQLVVPEVLKAHVPSNHWELLTQ